VVGGSKFVFLNIKNQNKILEIANDECYKCVKSQFKIIYILEIANDEYYKFVKSQFEIIYIPGHTKMTKTEFVFFV
jgi:hypothetical protein